MLELFAFLAIGMTISFIKWVIEKYKEDKLKSKLNKIFRLCTQEDILKGEFPNKILYEDTPLAMYSYSKYEFEFKMAHRKGDFAECEFLLTQGFLQNMGELFSESEYLLLVNNVNVKNHLKANLYKIIAQYNLK